MNIYSILNEIVTIRTIDAPSLTVVLILFAPVAFASFDVFQTLEGATTLFNLLGEVKSFFYSNLNTDSLLDIVHYCRTGMTWIQFCRNRKPCNLPMKIHNDTADTYRNAIRSLRVCSDTDLWSRCMYYLPNQQDYSRMTDSPAKLINRYSRGTYIQCHVNRRVT